MRRAQGGFTLIEVVLAMVLLGSIMVLMYSGLSFTLRSWDAGEANGRRTADLRLGTNFLRRELSELFPMRWKDAMEVRMAFEGDAGHLRFVSSRPAGLQLGGLSLVGVQVEDNPEKKTRDLVMLRAMPDHAQVDFGPLAGATRHVLMPGVDRVEFAYFGAENEFGDPRWHDSWDFKGRVPEMVRVRVRLADGSMLPESIVRVVLGEEAGCLENSFQRLCRPRRPT